MTRLKFHLICFMAAAAQNALCSAAQASSGASFSPGARGDLARSLPPDSDFVELSLIKDYFYDNWDSDTSVSKISFDECYSRAVSTGAGAFQHLILYYPVCYLYTLRYQLCSKRQGDFKLYVRKAFVADGTTKNDYAYPKGSLFRQLIGSNARYYRIAAPTILEYGDFLYRGPDSIDLLKDNFMVAAYPSDGQRAYVDRHIAVDPSCYTNSSCSLIFLTVSPEIPASDFLILHDICSRSFQVGSGKSLYLLSHAGIGCKNFPNNYPVAACWAEFTAAGKITINATLVNFSENGQCDGFTLTALTADAKGSTSTTNLCAANAKTELASAGGKVRINFGRSKNPQKKKYGFSIRVTSA